MAHCIVKLKLQYVLYNNGVVIHLLFYNWPLLMQKPHQMEMNVLFVLEA